MDDMNPGDMPMDDDKENTDETPAVEGDTEETPAEGDTEETPAVEGDAE